MGIFFRSICVIGCSLFLLTSQALAKTQENTSLSHYMMGLLNERWSEHDAAIEEYKQAEEFDYYSAQIHLKLGSQYLRNQEFAKALQQLELAVKLDPENIQSRFVLAILYSALGREEQASAEYEYILQESSKKEPENIQLYHNLAEFYFRQNKLDEAVLQYNHILKIDPTDKIAHLYLGNIYCLQEKKDLAIGQFKKAIEIDSFYADALNSLGYIYAEEGVNLAEAEELITRALAINPESGAYIDSLGWVYFQKGRYAEALAQLERAINIFPDPEIYDHLGDVYYKLEMFEEAEESWQNSLTINPLQKKIEKKLDKIRNKDITNEIQ